MVSAAEGPNLIQVFVFVFPVIRNVAAIDLFLHYTERRCSSVERFLITFLQDLIKSLCDLPVISWSLARRTGNSNSTH